MPERRGKVAALIDVVQRGPENYSQPEEQALVEKHSAPGFQSQGDQSGDENRPGCGHPVGSRSEAQHGGQGNGAEEGVNGCSVEGEVGLQKFFGFSGKAPIDVIERERHRR